MLARSAASRRISSVVRVVVLCTPGLISACGSAGGERELSAVDRDRITTELIDRLQRDQFYRTFDYSTAPDSVRRRLAQEASVTDSTNLVYIKALVARHGWPDAERFGKDAAHAAFVLVQHADKDPQFQEQMLPLVADAVERGEASARDMAYLIDRVRVKQGRPQVYGTQYDVLRTEAGGALLGPDGKLQYLLPVVVDAERIDERRATVGLGPWAEYEKRMAESQGRVAQREPRPDTTRIRGS